MSRRRTTQRHEQNPSDAIFNRCRIGNPGNRAMRNPAVFFERAHYCFLSKVGEDFASFVITRFSVSIVN